MKGGEGNDVLYGEAGNEGSGRDVLDGGNGRNVQRDEP